jgi:hypothetical protein
VVAGEDVDRHAIAVGVVDRHRRVLDADGAVAEHGHRLAFDLEVAVRHRHRRLFVQAGEELRHRVVAVVDDRLVDAAEARAGIRRHVLEVQRAQHVDHEVAARTVGGEHLVVGERIGLARRDGSSPGAGRCPRRSLGSGVERARARHEGRRAGHRGAFQKISPIHGQLF